MNTSKGPRDPFRSHARSKNVCVRLRACVCACACVGARCKIGKVRRTDRIYELAEKRGGWWGKYNKEKWKLGRKESYRIVLAAMIGYHCCTFHVFFVFFLCSLYHCVFLIFFHSAYHYLSLSLSLSLTFSLFICPRPPRVSFLFSLSLCLSHAFDLSLFALRLPPCPPCEVPCELDFLECH